MVEPFVIMDQIIIILLAGVIAAKISERFGLRARHHPIPKGVQVS
jgi:hypothetical protein